MKILSILFLLSLVMLPIQVRADDDDHVRARDLVEAGEILPLETLLQSVFQDRNWRLLEAELEKDHGRYIYELEILDDQGKVLELKYDARTGKALKRDKH